MRRVSTESTAVYKYTVDWELFSNWFWGELMPGCVIKPLFLLLHLLLAVLRQWFPLSKSELAWKSKRLRLLSIVIRAGHWPWVKTCPTLLSGSILHRRMYPHHFFCSSKLPQLPVKKPSSVTKLVVKEANNNVDKALLFLCLLPPLHDIYKELSAGTGNAGKSWGCRGIVEAQN